MNSTRHTRQSGKLSIIAATLASGAMLIAASAHAADIPASSPPPPPIPVAAPPIFTWTGFYLGVNGGWGTGRRNVSFGVVPSAFNPNIARLTPSGGIIGLQGGYNWQTGPLVVGLETDFQATGMRDRFGPTALAGGGTATGSSRLNWYGTVRGRVGYAFNRTLLFATGGLAYGSVRNRLTSTDGAANTFSTVAGKTRVGWTLGAGVEHAFTNNWTAKLEYGYVDFGRTTQSAAVFNAGVATGAVATTRNRNNFHTIRAGINYKF